MKLNYSTTSHRKRPQKKRTSRQCSRRSWDFHGHIPLSAFPLLLFTFLLAVGILFDIDLPPFFQPNLQFPQKDWKKRLFA